MQPQQTFKKSERLCNKNLIGRLFGNGKSFFEYPFKIMYLTIESGFRGFEEYPARVLFTISKRKFKKAVQRNRLKRLMREGYRKNKGQLYEALNEKNQKIVLAFVYTAKETMPYSEIEKKIKAALLRLQQDVKNNRSTN